MSQHPPAAPLSAKVMKPLAESWLLQAWQNGTMRLTPDHRQKTPAGAVSAAPATAARTAIASIAVWPTAPRCLVVATTAAALLAGLSGCVGGSPQVQPALSGPATAAASTAAVSAGAGPAATESGSTEPLAGTSGAPSAPAADAAATATVTQTVTDALGRLAAGSPKPATAQVTDALTGAGIAPAALQVSQSRTPTGLEADAIEAAVLQGKDCVIGQVRDGAVTVTVLPVLASGKCFVGS
ncbi:hypothetical protein SAMN05444745_11936 [Arthrobacter sp. OV608]|nr:hypothetical protein SAMN05444745_11936 [Arthrobacter sp. OV608]